MLPAQLHRRVPLDFEGREDVLTSSGFASLPSLAAGLFIRQVGVPLQAVGVASTFPKAA